MLKGRSAVGDPSVRLNRENLPKLLGLGRMTGVLSGFFGIGGGFLIVPGLMLASGMPILNAVGSSLVAVTAFGLTTAANYAAPDSCTGRCRPCLSQAACLAVCSAPALPRPSPPGRAR